MEYMPENLRLALDDPNETPALVLSLLLKDAAKDAENASSIFNRRSTLAWLHFRKYWGIFQTMPLSRLNFISHHRVNSHYSTYRKDAIRQ